MLYRVIFLISLQKNVVDVHKGQIFHFKIYFDAFYNLKYKKIKIIAGFTSHNVTSMIYFDVIASVKVEIIAFLSTFPLNYTQKTCKACIRIIHLHYILRNAKGKFILEPFTKTLYLP